MIEMSRYTGRNIDAVRSRMIASKDAINSTRTVRCSHVFEYTIQTLIMGPGFSLIPEGYDDPCRLTVHLDGDDAVSFIEYTLELLKKKHRNPKDVRIGNKHTIFSEHVSGLLCVDVLSWSSTKKET